MTAPSEPNWFTSSYSGGSGTECVECANVAYGVLIRDSKDTDSSVITVGTGAWRCFVDGLRKD
ncbi:hypothetical protein RKD26_004168 [Streptomyces calvus]|uniref:DUF397 domain-containing protein n=1 Tax=Streptomyces calvus TaxID=67282 RepID=UPI0035196627